MNKLKVTQFRATPKAQSKLDVLKKRLREGGVKPSIDIVLNTIIENITLAEFDRMAKSLLASNSVKSQIMQMFNNGQLTQEMLDALKPNIDAREE